jgi:hypothetical protein
MNKAANMIKEFKLSGKTINALAKLTIGEAIVPKSEANAFGFVPE